MDSLQRKELTKLVALRLLSDPEFEVGGLSSTDLARQFCALPYEDSLVDRRIILPSMEAEGLIERRPDRQTGSRHKSINFVMTDRGREYLEAAQQKALFPEINAGHDWSTNFAASRMKDSCADLIRRLPEFSGSPEFRVQEVTHLILQELAKNPSRGR